MADFIFKSEDRSQPISMIDVKEGEVPDSDRDIVEDKQYNETEATMDDLSFIAFGDGRAANAEGGMDVTRIHWSQNCGKSSCNDADIQVEAAQHLHSPDGPPIFLGQLKKASTVSRTKMMRLMTSQIESGYLSNVKRSGNALNFETYYNLQGDREPQIDGETVTLGYKWESLSFSYSFSSGRATYLLACSDEEFQSYKEAIGDQKLPEGERPHPFSIHLVLLFKGVVARNEELETALRRLLLFEDRSIFRRSRVTFESPDDTKGRLQELHSLFKEMLIRKNSNTRYIAITDALIRDLDRLQKAVQSTTGALPIDDADFDDLKAFSGKVDYISLDLDININILWVLPELSQAQFKVYVQQHIRTSGRTGIRNVREMEIGVSRSLRLNADSWLLIG
ncbi:MAG: hypothetical protein Q9223_007087 [Gallowayella weberi]